MERIVNNASRICLVWLLSTGLQITVLAQPVSTLLKNATREAKSGHFLTAATLWERAGRLKNADPALLYQAADAYAQARDYLHAADCYRASLEDSKFPLASLKYARALKQQGRYSEAEKWFETFAQNYHGDYKAVMLMVADNEIEGCARASKLFENQDSTMRITRLADTLNSAENEFAPIPLSSQLLYFSLATPDHALLLRSMQKLGTWGRPEIAQSLPEAVSARFNTGSFSADGARFYYAQCETGCPAQSGGSVVNAPCALYCLRRTEDGWAEPERLRSYINLEGSRTLFPQVSQSEGVEYLFFSSDRKGGFGGLDLYVCERPLESDQLDFSFPQNLGVKVNTGADEVSPFFQADAKVLWFSSLGHPSMGGMDVFKTEKEGVGWSRPQNAGIPINSPADDYFFVLKKSGAGAFLASNRSVEGIKPTTTDDDLFELNWPPK